MKDRTRVAIAVVYLATGLMTGWQAYRMIMWSIWGAPTSVWQGVAVGGAWVLLFAVPTIFARPFAGVVVGGIGCAQLWSFYFLAIYQTIWQIGEGRAVADPVVFLPAVLLCVATILSLVGLYKYRLQASS